MPSIGDYIAPIAKSQGKKQRSFVFQILNHIKGKSKLISSATLPTPSSSNNQSQLQRVGSTITNPEVNRNQKNPKSTQFISSNENDQLSSPRPSSVNSIATCSVSSTFSKSKSDQDPDSDSNTDREDLTSSITNYNSNNNINININNNNSSIMNSTMSPITPKFNRNSIWPLNQLPFYSNVDTNSTPEFSNIPQFQDPNDLGTPKLEEQSYFDSFIPTNTSQNLYNQRLSSPFLNSHQRTLSSSSLSSKTKIQLLKTNYFKNETQFLMALETIAIRLLNVPKEARLSTLRAEITMLNKDLPLQVDIPILLPRSKKFYQKPFGKLNKIVRISPAEVNVLNSAEKAPFLLLIEYLKDDFDFEPFNDENSKILKNLSKSNLKLKSNLNKKKSNSISNFSNYRFDWGFSSPQRFLNEEKINNNNDNDNDDYDNDNDNDNDIYDNNEHEHEHKNDHEKINTDLNLNLNDIEGGDIGDMSVVKLTNTIEETIKINLNLNNYNKNEGLGIQIPQSPTTLEPSETELTSPLRSISPDSTDIDATELATHMRIAVTMLSQLEHKNQTLSYNEIKNIKTKIISSMKSMQNHSAFTNFDVISSEVGDRKLENDMKTGGIASNKHHHNSSNSNNSNNFNNNKNNYYLGEDWTTKKERIRKESIYGHLPNWDLFSVIAKTGNDLRQEAFACQLIQAMSKCWEVQKIPVWVKQMRILITGGNTGLVETITNGISIHTIKKALTNSIGSNPKGHIPSLKTHFTKTFGNPSSIQYQRAIDAFVRSLAAYSVICYILQIKDRHNGNILLDKAGHVIHIDFGFMLSNSPGSVGFEAAPFKLTQEYYELMGGSQTSENFILFKNLVRDSFKALRKEADGIIILCEMMQKDSILPCFIGGSSTSQQLRSRFQLHLTDAECDNFVEQHLIQKSLGSFYTRLYDQFQLSTQGIYS